MDSPNLRQRRDGPSQEAPHRALSPPAHTKPAGKEHGLGMQIVRGFLLFFWMNTCCVVMHVTQLAGAWLYFVNKDFFYSWMTLTKQSFGVLITTITQWFAPMTVRVSGSRECCEQIRLDKNGLLDTTSFPERMILIANHQLYSDWLFLWWIAYTAKLHGHIFIILKESLKWIPVIGPGMQFYRFIFMARNWAKDQSRLRYRLNKLNTSHTGPAGSQGRRGFLDPMWLLIFPEGTNLSANTRRKSKAFADKAGVEDFKHVLLPRSTGLRFCLEELKSSVEWIYDCTIAYEGIPYGQYGQDVYTNRGIYFGGRPPKSVNMHWRRFHVSAIPLASQHDFEAWVMDRWKEKDALLEVYAQTGRFPANTDTPTSTPASSTILVKSDELGEGDYDGGYIETQVRLRTIVDAVHIFTPLIAVSIFGWAITKLSTSYLG